MPANAFEAVGPDYCVPVADMPELVVRLVGTEGIAINELAEEVPLDTVDEAESPSEVLRSDELGAASAFTCPECHGTLWQIPEGGGLRYRCRVGHAYSEDTMTKAQGQSTERTLWAALRALEERAGLLRKLADRARQQGRNALAATYEDKSRQVERDVFVIHALIVNGPACRAVGQ